MAPPVFLLLLPVLLSAASERPTPPRNLSTCGPSALRRYTLLSDHESWSNDRPLTLTYAFSATSFRSSLPRADVEAAFASAFGRWAAVIPVTFVRSEVYEAADIAIAFYSGEHGDESPFDGPLGVVAHSSGPDDGSFVHMDEAERWFVNATAGLNTAEQAVHVETVALHEIGNVLGLGHSTDERAVMFATYQKVKVELSRDDVEGAQRIYGVNPNYHTSATAPSSRGRSWVAGAVVAVLVLTVAWI